MSSCTISQISRSAALVHPVVRVAQKSPVFSCRAAMYLRQTRDGRTHSQREAADTGPLRSEAVSLSGSTTI
eukprot:scaffold95797_cov28-Tisochrysis_lutea.AAC.7